jgi:hypothetical protein
MLVDIYKKMKDGEAGSQEYKLIRDLAKDHGIEFNIEDPGDFKDLIQFPFDDKGNPIDEFYSMVKNA